jgi:hypothetical protein
MGIITEDPRLRIADSIFSNADLVRPPSRAETGTIVVSGRQSVALQRRCLIYRSLHAGHNVVNVIPLRSIDSFCIRTLQIRAILAGAIILLLLSAATGLWWYALPAAKNILVPNYEMNVSIADLYVTAAFLAAAMMLLSVYLVFRRVELVVYTLSGKNSIQLPLSRRLAASAEAFVAEVEAQINGATG